MKKINLKTFFLPLTLMFVLASCGGADSEGGAEGSEAAVMTTAELVAEANELGKEEFEKKYPKDSEIELQGEVRVLATWDDKLNAKFGTGLNDLPVKADFMFEANGGSKEAAKEKIKMGENVHFKGKVSFSFFQEDGKIKYVDIKDCVAQ